MCTFRGHNLDSLTPKQNRTGFHHVFAVPYDSLIVLELQVDNMPMPDNPNAHVSITANVVSAKSMLLKLVNDEEFQRVQRGELIYGRWNWSWSSKQKQAKASKKSGHR